MRAEKTPYIDEFWGYKIHDEEVYIEGFLVGFYYEV